MFFSTFTATVTTSTGVVVSSTETDEFTVTLPTTVSIETDVVPVTSTVEDTLTFVETVTTTTTVDPYVTPLAKRQVTASSSTYPAYASGCSEFPKYSSACSCLGVYPDTVTVPAPSTTVTVTATTTSTSSDISTTSTTETDYSSVTATTFVTSTMLETTTDASTTTTTTVVIQATPLVKNGGFESGNIAPWVNDYPNDVSASVTSPGSNSVFTLTTGLLSNNDLFELKQTLTSPKSSVWSCSYDWLFTNYYSTKYSNGNTYVPYVHVYINNKLVSNRYPSSDADAAIWHTASFTFTSKGSDTLYFDIASPQPPPGTPPPNKGPAPVTGVNYASIDNVGCVQVS